MSDLLTPRTQFVERQLDGLTSPNRNTETESEVGVPVSDGGGGPLRDYIFQFLWSAFLDCQYFAIRSLLPILCNRSIVAI